MISVNAGFGKDPIGKLQKWHDGAIAKQKEADEAAAKALYNSTVEKFESALNEISELDGSKAPLRTDTNPKPGEVNVFGVGSLRKTSDGFILETVKSAPAFGAFASLGFMGLPAQQRILPGSVGWIPPQSTQKEIFTVNTREQTIRHESKMESFGAWGGAGFGSLPSETTLSDVTIRTSDETVVARQRAADELGFLTTPDNQQKPKKGFLDPYDGVSYSS